MYVAPRTTVIEPSTTQGQVASDAPIVVYQISAESNSGTNEATFLDKDNTELFVLQMPIRRTAVISVPFRADNGLRVTAPANVTVTIFHSQPGI